MSLQPVTRHGTGHGTSMHDSTSEVIGHAVPPFIAWREMLRVCVRVPPVPQVWVHVVEMLHAEKTQSTGHGIGLHCLETVVRPGQAAPLLEAATSVRVWELSPQPQDLVHGLQSPATPL